MDEKCVCGHFKLQHHISWLPDGTELAEECIFYAWNEYSGLKLNEETATWVDHCHKFRRSEASRSLNY